MRILGSPRQYIQGPGALSALAPLVASWRAAPVAITDPLVAGLAANTVPGMPVHPFGGEVTRAEIGRLAAAVSGADLVIGFGGGKAIDTAKGVAHTLGLPLVVVPTIASNDAPTSRLIVLYDEAHRIAGVELMRWNPDVVLVDTAVIAGAPVRFLAAGIGDALSKLFEAHACAAAGGVNFFKASPPRAALALAEACYTTLTAHAAAALAAGARGVPDAAFEAVVEACVLCSGLGFESGGLSLAHSLTRGFTAVPGPRGLLHGELVAFGTLVQIAHEGPPEGFAGETLEKVAAFAAGCGLPVTLAALGLGDDDAALAPVIGPTLEAPYVGHLRRRLDAARLAEALRKADAAGRGAVCSRQ